MDVLFFDELEGQLDGFVVAEAERNWRLSVGLPVAQINVLVGPNNSGKSRILRELFRSDTFLVSLEDAERFHRVRGKLLSLRTTISPEHLIGRAATQFETADRRPFASFLVQDSPNVPALRFYWHGNDFQLAVEEQFIELGGATLAEIIAILGDPPVLDGTTRRYRIATRKPAWESRNYVPATRTTLRMVDSLDVQAQERSAWHDDPLAFTFLQTYGFVPNGDVHLGLTTNKGIFTGQRLYEEAARPRSESQQNRLRFKATTAMLLERLFGMKNAELLASEQIHYGNNGSATKIKQLIIESSSGEFPSTPVHEFGEGLSSVLSFVMPLLLHTQNTGALLIEEPENGLHPGLLRQAIELLCDPGIRGSVRLFLSTHSPVVLEAVQKYAPADMMVLAVGNQSTASKRQHVVTSTTGVLLRHLEELGATSNALLARVFVWVEGPSDVRYMRAMLSEVAPDLVEGRDFALLVLGGSLIDSSLKGNPASFGSTAYYSIVVCDSDKGKSALHVARYSALRAITRSEYIETQTIEFENLLGPTFWELALPRLGPKKWPKKRHEFPGCFESARMGALADYAFGVNEVAPPTSSEPGETLETNEKRRAAELFESEVRAKGIQLSDACRNLALKVAQWIRKPASIGLPSPSESGAGGVADILP